MATKKPARAIKSNRELKYLRRIAIASETIAIELANVARALEPMTPEPPQQSTQKGEST